MSDEKKHFHFGAKNSGTTGTTGTTLNISNLKHSKHGTLLEHSGTTLLFFAILEQRATIWNTFGTTSEQY